MKESTGSVHGRSFRTTTVTSSLPKCRRLGSWPVLPHDDKSRQTIDLAGGATIASLARMSETESLASLILLAVCAGCLLLLVVAVIRNGRCLRRIERSLKAREGATKSAAGAAGGRAAPARGEFETFLGEDPARLLLPKGEQAQAYRRWRQDKGLNWTKP
jgi:hypothetical protein